MSTRRPGHGVQRTEIVAVEDTEQGLTTYNTSSL